MPLEDDVVDSLVVRQRRATMGVAGDIDASPDDAARSLDLAQATGVAPSIINGDLESFDRRYKTQLATDIIRNNPHIQEYVSTQPMATKLSNDDYGNLDAVSQAVGNAFGPASFGLSTGAGQRFVNNGSLGKAFQAASQAFDLEGMQAEYGKVSQKFWEWDAKTGGHFARDPTTGAVLTAVAALPFAVPAALTFGVDMTMRMFNASIAGLSVAAGEYYRASGAQAPLEDLEAFLSGAPSGRLTPEGLTRDVYAGIQANSAGAHIFHGPIFGEFNKLAKTAHKIEPYILEGKEPPRFVDEHIDDLKYQQNQIDVKNLDKAISEAQKSATRERNPEIFAEFIRQHTDAKIGLSGDAVARLYGEKAPLPDDGILGFVPRIADQLEVARITGGDIEVPLADWLAKVDPEVAKALRDDTRVRAGGITKVEKETLKEVEKDKAEAIDPVTRVEQMRDQLAVEPMLQVPERKLELKRVSGERVLTQAEHLEGNISVPHSFEFIDQDGKPVGYIVLDEMKSGKKLYVVDVEGVQGYGPRSFGPRLMRDILRQIKEQFPNAEELSGFRVSGARDVAGSVTSHGEAALKLDEFSEAHYRLFNDITEGKTYDVGQTAKVTLPDVLKPHEKDLANAITEELNRIVPKDVTHSPVQRIEFQGREAQGLYLPQRKLLMWSLESDDPRKTARHEALHHLRQHGFFSLHEWNELTKAANEQGWHDKFDIDARYPTLREGLKVEEAIAEAFGEWRSGKLKAEGVVAQLFQRIKDLMDRIAYRVKEFLGRDLTPDEIFQMAEEGVVGSRKGTVPVFEAGSAAQSSVEKIKSAAIRFPDGHVSEGQIHADALDTGRHAGHKWTQKEPYEPGFTTSTGRFVLSDEAMEIAKKAEQVTQETIDKKSVNNWQGEAAKKWLNAEDLNPEGSAQRPPKQLEMPEMTRMEDRDPFSGIPGMTKAQMERYYKLIDKRLAEDTEWVTGKAIEDERRRQTATWKENEKPIREQVVTDYYNKPEVMADRFFRAGKIGENEFDSRPKLDPDVVPKELRDQLPERFFNAERGLHPDDYAGLFGFPDGKAMIDALIVHNLERVASALRPEEFQRRQINAEVSRRMERLYGNLRENIMEEVKDRVASETQFDILHEEMYALASMADTEFTISKEQIKTWSADAVGKSDLWTLSSDKLLENAGKAGRLAEDHLLKQKYADAFREKQRQYLNIAMAKEAIKVEREYDKFTRTAKRFSRREVNGVDGEYVDYIQALLAQADVPGQRGVAELQASIDARGGKSLEAFTNEQLAQGWEPAVSQDLLARGAKPLQEMTVAEFQEFKAAVDSLAHIGKAVNEIEVAGRTQQYALFKDEVMRNLKELPIRNAEGGKNLLYWGDASLVKMENLIKDLDLRKELGPLFNAIIRPVQEAKSREWTMLDKLRDDLDIIGKKGGFDKEWRKSLDDVIPQDFLHDPYYQTDFQLTRQNMINIMLNFGNRSNIEKFTKGWVANRENLSRKQLDVAAGQLEMRLKLLFDRHATKADWDYAQHIWDIFDGFRKESDSLSRDVSGVPAKWIPAESINTRHGTYAGGYFPIIYDPLRSGITATKERPSDLFQSNYFRATTAQGHLKERTGNVDFIKFDNTLEEIGARMGQTIHDISHRKAVMNVGKVVYDKEIRGEIRRRYGQEYDSQFSAWLQDVANSTNLDEQAIGAWNKVGRVVRTNLMNHALGLNLRVILSPSLGTQNPVGIVRDSIMKQVRPETKEFAMEHSLELKHTMRNLDRDFREQMERNITSQGYEGVQAAAARWAFAPVMWVEEGLRVNTWTKEYHNGVSRGLSHSDAVAVADSALRERHGASGTADLPAIMRHQNEGMKVITMFYGYFNTVYNWQREIPGQLKRGEMKDALKAAYGAVIVPALFGALFFNQQKEGDSWFKTIGKALVMQPLQTVPFINQATSYFFEGFPPRSPLESLLTAYKSFSSDVVNWMNHKPANKPIQHVANVIGLSTGLPLAQVGRTSQFGADVASGKQRPRTFAEWVRGIVNGEAKLKR